MLNNGTRVVRIHRASGGSTTNGKPHGWIVCPEPSRNAVVAEPLSEVDVDVFIGKNLDLLDQDG